MIQKTVNLLFLLGLFSQSCCYFVLIHESKSWTEAQSFCREFHLDLATVQSDEDRFQIQEVSKAVSFTNRGWMGFYGGVGIWRWSYRNETPVFNNWDVTESPSVKTQRMCGVIKISGQWSSSSCEELKPFFCYTGDYVGNKYVLIKVKLNWGDAQLYCRAKYVDLASVTDIRDNIGLLVLLKDSSLSEVWIGLFKNLWVWSDGSPVHWLSVKWTSDEPDNGGGAETCAFAQANGLTGDENCAQSLPFFCRESDFCFKVPLKSKLKWTRAQVFRVTLKVAGSFDKTALMLAVQKKMNSVLLEQRMDNTSVLTWRIQPDGEIFTPQKEENASGAGGGKCVSKRGLSDGFTEELQVIHGLLH